MILQLPFTCNQTGLTKTSQCFKLAILHPLGDLNISPDLNQAPTGQIRGRCAAQIHSRAHD